MRIDYTNGSAQLVDVIARDVISAYGPGFTRHALDNFLPPDGWELVPHEPGDPDEGWTFTPSADGRERPIRRTTMPDTTTPAADAALALYLPSPAADFVVAFDNTHPTRPYLAQCTATLGRASTHEEARRILADHHDQLGARTEPEIPYELDADDAALLLRLAAQVAVESERDGDDTPYDRALRAVAGNWNPAARAALHERALRLAEDIENPR
ncbi:MAG TPA: hypothetical protein VFG15_03190 [Amycolatopsis sp.]|nr:hypothetical protein [Amycolatopsis sp.]